MTIRINKRKLLLGEGIEEVKFFDALLRYLQISDVQTIQYGGKSNLKNMFPALVKSSGFSSVLSIGITRDADDDFQSAFQSVCSGIKKANLPIPEINNSFIGKNPKIGISIISGDGNTGMLEDLCLNSISDDPAIRCVDDFISCIQQVGCNPKNLSKAKIHTWLASRDRSDMKLGDAALAKCLSFDHSTYESLIKFLRQI